MTASIGVRLHIVPITLREANRFVEQFHRHNGRTARDGGKYAIGVSTGEALVGVAIVGRPLARLLNDGWTAEVLRTCAIPDAPKNVNSCLYAACWRIWREMGGKKLITYTLQTESGESLKGAGFQLIANSSGGSWDRPKLGRMREWQPIFGQMKFRWEKTA